MCPPAADVKECLRGVTVGLLTPFSEDRKVAYEKLAENATSLYKGGIRSFMSPGNISEFHSLSQSERIQSAATSVEALPDDACVLAGVGGSTATAKNHARAYAEEGVDALLIMPPNHTYIHERGLLEYVQGIAGATDRPLVPYIRGFEPSVDYLSKLTTIDDVVAVKYAITDPITLGAGVAASPEDTVWVNGIAEPYAPAFWAEGIEGFSAGVSNFRPEVGLALYDALQNEEWARARELRNICLPYQRFRDETGENNSIPGAISVPLVKKGLELAGLHGGPVREPLRPLSEREERKAEELYAELDTEIDRLIT